MRPLASRKIDEGCVQYQPVSAELHHLPQRLRGQSRQTGKDRNFGRTRQTCCAAKASLRDLYPDEQLVIKELASPSGLESSSSIVHP